MDVIQLINTKIKRRVISTNFKMRKQRHSDEKEPT